MMNSRLTTSVAKRTTIPSPFLLSLIIDKITIYSFIYNVSRYIGEQINGLPLLRVTHRKKNAFYAAG